jgi:glycosyltransferase involved in cell wall biosynthesis
MRVRLSLAMIVKNEETLLGRVLDSAAAVCDEMIVVDTGSTDATRAVAEEHGASVHEIAWRDDFATARNASFAWCTGDWILWLDADDVLPTPTQQAIMALKSWLNNDVDAVAGPYHYSIADTGTVLLNVFRERLIRRESGLRWEGKIHEVISLPASRSVFVPELVIEHRPDPQKRALNVDRNVKILEAEIAGGHPLPRTLFYYANELYDHQRWGEAAHWYREYLDVDRLGGADRYWALLYLAEASRVLGDTDSVRDAATRAIAVDPSRAEAYMALARLYYDEEQWAKAAPLFVAATAATAPTTGMVRNVDYLYAPWDFLSVCLDRMGRRAEALTAAQQALEGNPEADRVRANMRWIVDNL